MKNYDNINLIDEMTRLYKMFADGTRIKILYLLKEHKLNVCDLAMQMNMTQSAISHQLAILKMNNLLKCEKNGKEVFYSLADDHILSILQIGEEHAKEKL